MRVVDKVIVVVVGWVTRTVVGVVTVTIPGEV